MNESDCNKVYGTKCTLTERKCVGYVASAFGYDGRVASHCPSFEALYSPLDMRKMARSGVTVQPNDLLPLAGRMEIAQSKSNVTLDVRSDDNFYHLEHIIESTSMVLNSPSALQVRLQGIPAFNPLDYASPIHPGQQIDLPVSLQDCVPDMTDIFHPDLTPLIDIEPKKKDPR